MQSPLRAPLAIALALVVATPTLAGLYTDLIVFGDSLSDAGNTSAATFGFVPGSNYFEGRFSNGPTYAERLSAGLGLGPLTRDGAGGDNFAYGGAETNGPGGFEGLFLNSLVEQIDTYLDRLAGRTPDPATLFVVFIGANDFLRAGQTNPAVPAGVVRTQLGRLIGAGARQVLGINLPLLGLTPEYNTRPTEAATISGRAAAYNDALDVVYTDAASANPAVTLHRLDVEALFNGFVADAAALGFVNTTQAGRDASGGSLDGAPGYVFWDSVHPTREAHALLGEAALRLVHPAGDYNRDGTVTTADREVWAAAYGTRFNAATYTATRVAPSLAADGNGDGRVDAADYTLWRDRLPSAVAAIPEPGSVWVAAAVAGSFARRRASRTASTS